MQSGLADFDVKGFDDALLKQGTSVHSPLEFLLLGTGRHALDCCFILMWSSSKIRASGQRAQPC